jgi:acyl carrier protein
MAVQTKTKKPTAAEIEALVIDLVAEQMGIDPAALRAQLEAKGEAMPIDSLELFNILVEFHKRTGLILPKKIPQGTMRSVRSFAKFAARKATVAKAKGS